MSMEHEITSYHAVTISIVQEMIDYIEEHLLETLTPASIAKQFYLCVSSVNTLFKIVCDVAVMEYVRNRRLSLAGEELMRSDMRIIDLAVEYGYESSEAFTKAFTRFHGFPPSFIRRGCQQIKMYSRLQIKVEILGGWENPKTNQNSPRQANRESIGYNESIKIEGGMAMKTGAHAHHHVSVKDMKYKEDWRILLALARKLDERGIAYKVDGKTMIFAHGLEFQLEKICLTFKWNDEREVQRFFGFNGKAEKTFPGFKYFDTLFEGMKIRCMFYGDCPGDDTDGFLLRNTDLVNVDGQMLPVQTLEFYYENAEPQDEYYTMVEQHLKHQA